MSKFLNISEISKLLNLIDPKTKRPKNYILRYWEKQFKQIKSKKINNQRYYSEQQVEIIKLIKFLLKNQKMTISGVKQLINLDINKLDDYKAHSLKTLYYKNSFKEKTKIILGKLKKLKHYGKKNSFKS